MHRRQRSELLQRPLWQIAVERIRVFFSEHSMGQLTYAGSMAAVLLVGFGAIGLMTQRGGVAEGRQASAAKPQPVVAVDRSFKLEVDAPPAPFTRAFPVAQPVPMASQPRYIIDARPVSYEPSRNIAF